MRYALSLAPFTAPATVVELACDAEAAGWDGVFLWDHLVWSPKSRPDVYDPWVLLGAIAQATERIRIGTLVTPLTRRRVQVVGKHLVTLDHLSGGRVTFGVGLGEPPYEDFAAFGDESDPRVRGAMLDESLVVLDRLLRGETLDHDGPSVTAHGELRPGPRQLPRPPFWVAGVVPNQPPLRRARRFEGVVPIGRGDLTPEQLAAYIGADRPEGWDVVAPWADGRTAQEYAEAGATWLTISETPVGDWVPGFRARIRRGPR